MHENNLLDEDSIDSKNSVTDYHFKLIALGAMIFSTCIYSKYLLQNAINYFGVKFGFGVYSVFWSNKILSLFLAVLLLRFLVQNRWSSLMKNKDVISRFITIHFIVLTAVLVLHQVLAKIINQLYTKIDFNVDGFIYTSEYMSFVEIADPLVEIISLLLLIFTLTRNSVIKNG